MKIISAEYIGNIIVNLLIFILLIAIYTYILKLENTGCACSNHPYKDFIKNFTVFALIFLAFMTFIPTNFLLVNFGSLIAGLFAFIKFVFYIVSIVYFYMVLDYTRYLINEKCKCSEDMRREFILVGSTVEVIILVLIFLVIIVLPLIFNSVSFIVSQMDNYEKEVSVAIRNPYKSVKTIPNKLSKSTKIISKIASTTKKGFKTMTKPNKY